MPEEESALACWMSVPLRPLILLAIPLTVTGCRAESKRPLQPTVGLEGVRTQGERGLLLTFVGGPPPTDAMDPCEKSYRPDVVQSGDRVVVTVRERPSTVPLPRGFSCALVGYFRTASVELGRPLGDRVLVDGTTGRQRRPFDGATLLSPRFLPDGWAMLQEGPGFDEPEQSVEWRRTFGPPRLSPRDGRCAETVTPVSVSQSPDAGVLGPGEPVELRGTRGTVVHDTSGGARIRWAERGQVVEVADTPSCAGTPQGDVDLLLRIAGGLA
jgi:hypothetical protein